MQFQNLTDPEIRRLTAANKLMRMGTPAWGEHLDRAINRIVLDPCGCGDCGDEGVLACTWSPLYSTDTMVLRYSPMRFTLPGLAELLRHESDHHRFDVWGNRIKVIHDAQRMPDAIYARGVVAVKIYTHVHNEFVAQLAEQRHQQELLCAQEYGFWDGVLDFAKGAAIGAGIGLTIRALAGGRR